MILKEDMDQLNYSLLSVKSNQTIADINYENALKNLAFVREEYGVAV